MGTINKSYLAAGGLVGLLVLWMASGLLTNDTPNADASPKSTQSTDSYDGAPATGELMKVEVRDIKPSMISREITLQGQLDPKRHLLIRAETTGVVKKIPVTKGHRVEKDAPLVELSLDGRDADLLEAQARIKKAFSEKEAATKLRKQGLQSQLQLEQAEANLAAARAVVARTERAIEQTKIHAPFNGIINDVPVEVGQQIDRGTIAAEIIDDSVFIVSASVAQQTVQLLSVDQPVTVKLITGSELPGRITFISAVAQANTRTFIVEAEVANTDGATAAGVSASVIIPVEQLEAIFLSPSSITLGQNGEIGVKTVNADNTVEFHTVSLVRTTSEGAWVTGVPINRRVITLGQGFVNAGEQVIPVDAPLTLEPAS